jgi:hypothetical protein
MARKIVNWPGRHTADERAKAAAIQNRYEQGDEWRRIHREYYALRKKLDLARDAALRALRARKELCESVSKALERGGTQ